MLMSYMLTGNMLMSNLVGGVHSGFAFPFHYKWTLVAFYFGTFLILLGCQGSHCSRFVLLCNHQDWLLHISQRNMFRLASSVRGLRGAAAFAVPMYVSMPWAKPHLLCMEPDPSALSPGRRIAWKMSHPSSPGKAPKPMVQPEHNCQCCQQDIGSCFCPRAVRQFTSQPNAYFTDASGVKVFWPRLFKADTGALRFGCAVCMQHNAGVLFHAKNVISKGMLEVKSGKLCKATLDGHVKKGHEGDHGRCVDNYNRAMGGAKVEEGGAASRFADRSAKEPSIQLLNHFSWLYLALALPVSASKFSSIITMANDTGADVMPNQYMEKHFFTQGMKCFDVIISEAVFATLKKARRVAWHIDVGGGVLLIRYYALTEKFRRVSHYVQGRTVASHTADGLFVGFVEALTKATDNVPDAAIRLTDKEVYDKSAVFLADGASTMGVRRKGASASSAFQGKNFFSLLQKQRDEFCGTGEVPPILGYWCENHRYDQIASDAESAITYVSALLALFRSIIGHIMGSDRAKGLLDYMALLLETDDNAAPDVAQGGSLSSVHYAPQRWLSTVKPLQVLTDKVEHLLMYALELSLDPRHKYMEFGMSILQEFKDIRFHLVLPGILDCNEILDDANKQLQSLGVNIWGAFRIRKSVRSRFDDLVLRQKSDANNEKKAKFIEAGLAWFKGDLVKKALSPNPCHFEKALVKLRLANQSKEVHFKVVFKDKIKTAQGGTIKSETVIVPMSADLLKESLSILRAYAKVITDGIDKRFVNSGVTDDAVNVFSVDYEPKSASHIAPKSALERLAKHFRVPLADMHNSWEFLQIAKEDVVAKHLGDDVLSGKTRADLTPTAIWAEVLTVLSANDEEVRKAAPASTVLEIVLLINPTNAAVERDASIARLVHECTSNRAETDLLDTRMRIKIEGPNINKAVSDTKGGREYHPLVREAAKEFLLDNRLLHGTSAGKVVGPMPQEHKVKLRESAKRKRVASTECLARDVQIGEQATASLDEQAAVPGVAVVTEDIEAFISGLDSGEYASAGPPQAKSRAKRAQGRGRGLVGPALEVVEEEPLAPSDGSSSAGSAAEAEE